MSYTYHGSEGRSLLARFWAASFFRCYDARPAPSTSKSSSLRLQDDFHRGI